MALKEILKKTELFSGLDEESLAEICASSRMRTYKKDGVVLMQGDLCEGLALVLKGEVAVEIYNQEGDAIMVDLLDAGSLIGEELLSENEIKYPYTVVSCSSSELCFFSKNVVLSLLDRNVHFRKCFFKTLSEKLLRKNRHIAILSQRTLRQKVCCFIRESCVMQDQEEVVLPASREILAKYLAIPRPSFSRELAQLVSDGIIQVDGRKVRIMDRQQLEHILSENVKELPLSDS